MNRDEKCDDIRDDLCFCFAVALFLAGMLVIDWWHRPNPWHEMTEQEKSAELDRMPRYPVGG